MSRLAMACRRCSWGVRAAPGALGAGLLQHLLVLLRGRAFKRFSRHQLAQGEAEPTSTWASAGATAALPAASKKPRRATMAMKAQQKEGAQKAHAGIIDKTRIHHVRRVPPSLPFPSTPPRHPRPSWLQTLRVYLEPASLRMLALGFSAGCRCCWCWAR